MLKKIPVCYYFSMWLVWTTQQEILDAILEKNGQESQ